MSHRNALLSFEGRRRLVQRCQYRPIFHVAAEMGISRQYASKWVNCYREFGEARLHDRGCASHRKPTATPAEVVMRIEAMRREHKWSAARITLRTTRAGRADQSTHGYPPSDSSRAQPVSLPRPHRGVTNRTPRPIIA